jgi:serine/threonine-protein phosphatase PP1 catalytic subunit
VERFHSTLAEMARCLKEERSIDDVVELLYTTAIEYNRTVHSRILERPIDVLYSPALEKVVKERLKNAQERDLTRFNKKRQHRLYNLGDVVYVKVSKRRGTKLTLRFVKRKIQADLGSTVLIRGRVVHKDSLR